MENVKIAQSHGVDVAPYERILREIAGIIETHETVLEGVAGVCEKTG